MDLPELPPLLVGLFVAIDFPVRYPLMTPPSHVPTRGVRTASLPDLSGPEGPDNSSRINASELTVAHMRSSPLDSL